MKSSNSPVTKSSEKSLQLPPIDLKGVLDASSSSFFHNILTLLFLKKDIYTPRFYLNLCNYVLSSKGNSQNSNHQQAATPQEASVSKSQFEIQKHNKLVSRNKLCTSDTTHVISSTRDHSKT